MNRFLLALLALLAIPVPAAAAERTYAVSDFDRIQVEGPFEVVLATGQSTRVRATGSAQALERLSVEVQGRTLHVRINRSAWGGYPGQTPGPVRVEAATIALARAAVVGSGSLTIDKARGLRIDLSMGGSGQLNVGGIDADNLVVSLIGSGHIDLAGRAKQMRATVSGSGDLDGRALKADDIQLSTDSAGTVVLGSARSARIIARGAGDVTIGGDPACTVDAQGAGTVRCGS
jgi:hypothetical protein